MVEAYRASVRTRSTGLDYRWLNGEPAQWWLAPDWGSSLLRLSEATLLIQGSAEGRGVYLGGIQSSRRDSVQSRIRYEIALIPCAPDEVSLTADEVSSLLAAWWNQRSTGSSAPWDLGQQIDAALAAEAGVPAESALDAIVDVQALTDLQMQAVLDVMRSAGAARAGSAAIDPDLSDAAWIGAGNTAVPTLIAAAISDDRWERPIAYFAQIRASDMPSQRIDALPRHALLIVDGEAGVHAPKAPVRAPDTPRPPRPTGLDPRLRVVLIGSATVLVAIAVVLIVRRMKTGE